MTKSPDHLHFYISYDFSVFPAIIYRNRMILPVYASIVAAGNLKLQGLSRVQMFS